MGDLGGLLNIALSIVAVATLAGYGFVRGRIKQLEQRAESAEREETALRTRLAAAEANLGTCQADLKALSRVVTNEVHILALKELLETYHGENKEQWGEAMTVWRDLLDAYRGPR
jgi:uncharacterized protein HemX